MSIGLKIGVYRCSIIKKIVKKKYNTSESAYIFRVDNLLTHKTRPMKITKKKCIYISYLSDFKVYYRYYRNIFVIYS